MKIGRAPKPTPPWSSRTLITWPIGISRRSSLHMLWAAKRWTLVAVRAAHLVFCANSVLRLPEWTLPRIWSAKHGNLGFEVTGVDIAENMVRKARELDPTGNYR